MRFGSLFAGIGGLDLGLERAGMTCAFQVERNPFCRQVLAKHWPDVPRWGDIAEVNPHELPAIDLLAGGFPCQPHSLAGKRKADEDDRDLWGEFVRLIRGARPRWVLAENVRGLLSSRLAGIRGGFFGKVLRDLAELGFDAEWQMLPAAACGAPHIRERVFIVAHARGEQPERGRASGVLAGAAASGPGQQGERQRDGRAPLDRGAPGVTWRPPTPRLWVPEPDVARVVDGPTARLDPHRDERVTALGNLVVPAVGEYLGELIMQAEAPR